MERKFRFPAWLILIVFSFIALQCQKNPPADNPPTIDPLAEKVTASIKGRVTDENGKPVKDAAVTSGTAATTTTINGVFRLDNVQLTKNASFVTVEKTGYLKGCRTFLANAGNINNIEIQLIPKVNRGNFQSAAGGNIVIQNGSSVSFPANGIVNATTNAAYTGTVNVVGSYLDPLDPKLSLIMPGNLTGLTSGNEIKVLQTFGMIAVQLEGGSGEKLNLASGKTATITMPIPSSLLANAPATIPLWYFDETKGLWKEEGSASKQGSNYVGTVSHFSFWNCDVPNNFVTLKLTLKDQNAQPAAGYQIQLRNTANNSTAYAITDSSGSASGAVPPGVSLEMKIYNKCNQLVHTQTIGPFSTATDLGAITITTAAPASITISGTVKNCALSNVTNGFADVIIDGSTYRTATNNGNFSITIQRCNGTATTAQIIGMDLQANQQSTSMPLNVTSGNYSTGDVIACGVSIAEFINFTIAGNPQNFIPPADSFLAYRQSSTTNIQSYSRSYNDSVNFQYTSLSFDGITSPGTYTISNQFIVTKGIYPASGSKQYNLVNPVTLTITEYGSTGQYIAGSFSGSMKEFYTNAIVNGSCSFRVRRLF
jgi:hypothetical protein